jgi:glycosyltransferase involved in cell wall biosynthesis
MSLGGVVSEGSRPAAIGAGPGPRRPLGPGAVPPFLTVVVIASRHRDLVGRAIDSVLGQSLDPARYELLVVADYEDPDLNAQLAAHGGRITRVPPGDIGPAIEAGVRESRGEVLAFLDDDDRFLPGKLARIEQVFRDNPRLGFYRNAYVPIDAEDRPRPQARFRRDQRRAMASLGPLLLDGEDRFVRLRALPPLGLDFNSSSMAVRREVLVEFLPRLDLAGFRLLDALAFFAALSADCAWMVDPAELTGYRIHPRNSSLAAGASEDPLEGPAAFARRVAPSFEKVVAAARTTGSPDVILESEGLLEVQRAYKDLRDPDCGRRQYLARLRSLRRYREAYLVRSEPRLPLALALFILSPFIGRRLYRREMGGQSLGASRAEDGLPRGLDRSH